MGVDLRILETYIKDYDNPIRSIDAALFYCVFLCAFFPRLILHSIGPSTGQDVLHGYWASTTQSAIMSPTPAKLEPVVVLVLPVEVLVVRRVLTPAICPERSPPKEVIRKWTNGGFVPDVSAI